MVSLLWNFVTSYWSTNKILSIKKVDDIAKDKKEEDNTRELHRQPSKEKRKKIKDKRKKKSNIFHENYQATPML